MQVTPWRPFDEMDELLRRFAKMPALTASGDANAQWAPTADISESKKEYLIKAELPGVEKKDIAVDLDRDRLTIRGERSDTQESKDETYHRKESFYGTFSRTFALPSDVDASKLRAESKNGVLQVHLPKSKNGKKKPSQQITVE
ncbi:MAG: Hsp20/alpha crystallin family protein [Pseudomonadales bacterium]